MRIFLSLFLCLLLLFPVCGHAMSIEQAYQAIPHKQTTFSPQQSRLPSIDARYLDFLFTVTDIAMRARVMTLQTMYHGKGEMRFEQYDREIRQALDGFKLVQTPPHLQEVEDLIVASIRAQHTFFEKWDSMRGTSGYQQLRNNYTGDVDVLSAHKNLLAAYYKLMALYPDESQHNLTAFFDHLCALDFI